MFNRDRESTEILWYFNVINFRKSVSGLKPRRQALHDACGRLVADGRDLCDCQDPDCPGCHYPCPQCQSEKCGSSCRCDRRWSYDHVDVYHEGSVMR